MNTLLSAATPSFSLKIERQDGEQGEIALKILLKNTSDHIIHPTKAPGLDNGEKSGFSVVVSDTEGRSAPESEYFREWKDRESLRPGRHVRPSGGVLEAPPHWKSEQVIDLLPGEIMEDKIVVTRLYNLEPGQQYTVQVKRTDYDTRVVVRSNSILLTTVGSHQQFPAQSSSR